MRCIWAADCLKEIDAQRVNGYALYKDGKDATLPYPLEKFHSDVAGRSFHNGRFIQRMREKAATLPKYFPFTFKQLHGHETIKRELSFFCFVSNFLVLQLLMGMSFWFSIQCEIGTRNSHISGRRKGDYQRGAVQNQDWSGTEILSPSDYSMRWLFLKLATISMWPKGSVICFPTASSFKSFFEARDEQKVTIIYGRLTMPLALLGWCWRTVTFHTQILVTWFWLILRPSCFIQSVAPKFVA